MSKKKTVSQATVRYSRHLEPPPKQSTSLNVPAPPVTQPTSEPWGFNIIQLATYAEARALVEYLNWAGTGNGVLPGDDENGIPMIQNPNFPWLPASPGRPGIYLPPWVGGPGGFAQPHYTDPTTGEKYFHLHLRFRNGAEGMNVGLIRDKFRRHPNAPAYVLNEINKEADSLRR